MSYRMSRAIHASIVPLQNSNVTLEIRCFHRVSSEMQVWVYQDVMGGVEVTVSNKTTDLVANLAG